MENRRSLPTVPKEKWSRLAARIKAIIQNLESLFVEDNEIDNYQTVDVQSLENYRICRVTNRLKTKSGHMLFIRKCSEPEHFHNMIYDALHMAHSPYKTKKYKIKICSDP